MSASQQATDMSDREIIQTRTFNAPRALVFKAWTDPKHVDQWFGPRDYKTVTKEMDFRPGGSWRFTMTGPLGVFPNRVDYLEIVPPERIVYDQGDDEKHWFQVTVTFNDVGGKTELVMRSVFPTKEGRDFVVEKMGAIEGGRQTLEKLEKYLPQL